MLESVNEFFNTTIGNVPLAALTIALLAAPTLLYGLYRLTVAGTSNVRPRKSRIPGALWVCPVCKSANDLTEGRCYRCSFRADDAVNLLVIDPMTGKPIQPTEPGTTEGPGVPVGPGPAGAPGAPAPALVPAMTASIAATDPLSSGAAPAPPVAIPVIVGAKRPVVPAPAAPGPSAPPSPVPVAARPDTAPAPATAPVIARTAKPGSTVGTSVGARRPFDPPPPGATSQPFQSPAPAAPAAPVSSPTPTPRPSQTQTPSATATNLAAPRPMVTTRAAVSAVASLPARPAPTTPPRIVVAGSGQMSPDPSSSERGSIQR